VDDDFRHARSPDLALSAPRVSASRHLSYVPS
jgi:hypothetical protein